MKDLVSQRGDVTPYQPFAAALTDCAMPGVAASICRAGEASAEHGLHKALTGAAVFLYIVQLPWRRAVAARKSGFVDSSWRGVRMPIETRPGVAGS